MVIDYNEIVGVLEDLAHDVDQGDAAKVYAVLTFVSELVAQHGEVLERNAAQANTIQTYQTHAARQEGKYAALHDYCAVVEAERNELRGQLEDSRKSTDGFRNIAVKRLVEIEVLKAQNVRLLQQADTLAKGFMQLFADKFLGL